MSDSANRAGRPGRRLMAVLVIVIAILVIGTLFFYGGLRRPEQGPGNVPAQGEAPPLRDNGSPPASK
uniref:hypothetical protein n=1 Tax=Variovorax sp. BK018 TaxID=3450241 RepID=UPI0040390BD0